MPVNRSRSPAASRRGDKQIFIEMCTPYQRQRVRLDVRSSDTIGDVKAKLHREICLPWPEQELFRKKRSGVSDEIDGDMEELINGKTLASYRIEKLSTLYYGESQTSP